MSARARARKTGFVAVAVLLAGGLAAGVSDTTVSPSQTAAARAGWVGGWAAALTNGGISITGRTVRMVVTNTVPGAAVRVRLSDLDGASPLRIGAVDIAVQADGGDAVPGSSLPVTFSGSAAATIPAGTEVTSDPIAMTVAAQENLLVSIYLPGDAGLSSWHNDAHELTYESEPGNFAAEDDTVGYTTAREGWYYLEGLDVQSATARCTVVAFGDSITNGDGATVSADERWPDFLARRLEAVPGGGAFGVVDEGIDGNRVLSSSVPVFGRSALQRFAHDALGEPGVKDVILLEGINDIGSLSKPHPTLTAQKLIDGYLTLIGEAHADGVKIYGATILPYQGAFYYSRGGEAVREAVNRWILTSGAYDGTFDLARAMGDPSDPLRLNPAYDSGDHLHPDDAGYQAMADAIDLARLSC
jgi:lysophospholipase L1-like esterase